MADILWCKCPLVLLWRIMRPWHWSWLRTIIWWLIGKVKEQIPILRLAATQDKQIQSPWLMSSQWSAWPFFYLRNSPMLNRVRSNQYVWFPAWHSTVEMPFIAVCNHANSGSKRSDKWIVAVTVIRGFDTETRLMGHCSFYYMACSTSGQDELNPALWLANRAGKMERHCPFGICRFVPAITFHPSLSGSSKVFFRKIFSHNNRKKIFSDLS